MLDEATLKLVTDGFADMKSTVSQVLTVAIPAIIREILPTSSLV